MRQHEREQARVLITQLTEILGITRKKGSPKKEEVKALLKIILRKGPVEYNRVIHRITKKVDVGERTISKAKAELGIKTKRKGSGRNGTHKVYWCLG